MLRKLKGRPLSWIVAIIIIISMLTWLFKCNNPKPQSTRNMATRFDGR